MTTLILTWFTMAIGGILLQEPLSTTTIIIVVGVGVLCIWVGYKIYKSVQSTAEAAKKKREEFEKEK